MHGEPLYWHAFEFWISLKLILNIWDFGFPNVAMILFQLLTRKGQSSSITVPKRKHRIKGHCECWGFRPALLSHCQLDLPSASWQGAYNSPPSPALVLSCAFTHTQMLFSFNQPNWHLSPYHNDDFCAIPHVSIRSCDRLRVSVQTVKSWEVLTYVIVLSSKLIFPKWLLNTLF